MIPLRKLSQRNLLLIASLFLIQPIELLECFGIDFIPTLLNDTYYPTLKTVIDSGNFLDMIVANAGIGQLASLFWAVDTGRLLQAPGLFILGMILARGDYFSCGAGFWVKTFVGSFIASFLFYVAKTSAVDALQIILTMWYNMAFTGMLVSMFVITYPAQRHRRLFQNHCREHRCRRAAKLLRHRGSQQRKTSATDKRNPGPLQD